MNDARSTKHKDMNHVWWWIFAKEIIAVPLSPPNIRMCSSSNALNIHHAITARSQDTQ